MSEEIVAPRRGLSPRPRSRSRRLVYGDLPAVLAIERRSFETPWSLAMFVLELSKPSGICLAFGDQREIDGYLVCSRYADVWHLMNIAVVPDRRREGIATELIERLFAEAGRGGPLHARGPDLESRRDRDVRGLRLQVGRTSAPLLPRQRRGRSDHVARVRGRAGLSLILALETSCDDTCAAVIDGAEVRSNVVSSQAAAHERFGGIVPEVASRHHLELVNPVVDAALTDADVALGTSTRSR